MRKLAIGKLAISLLTTRTVTTRTVGWTLLPGLVCLALAGCGVTDSSAPQSKRLTLSGSSTVAPVVLEVAKRFEALHPGLRIDVQTGGSGKGIADVRQGMVDIGMTSRPLKGDEQDLTSHPIAVDGVALIVHRSNPIGTLTEPQVVAIYTGQINNWKDVGGNDAAITVVHKAEGRATLEVFLEYFRVDNRQVTPDVIVGENEHGVRSVASVPGAIGYVSIGTAEVNAQSGVDIKLLPLGGHDATTANVASGLFPMSRPLNFVTLGDPSELVRDFLEYAQSEAVHDILAEQYFVPISR